MNDRLKTKKLNDARKKLKKARTLVREPIDKYIFDTVVVLDLHGFSTTASWGGNVHGSYCYPWVYIKQVPGALQRLKALLERFYAFRYYGDSAICIVELNKDILHLRGRSADLLERMPQELLPPKVRESILRRYRNEMDEFSRFLLAEFYALP